MGIDSKHPSFTEWEPRWKQCRDCCKGEYAVKDAGEAYLPKLGGQSDDEYKAYRNRAMFANATGKTVDGLVGAIMRINPIVEGISDDMAEDVTGSGVALNDFVSRALSEQILIGRQGILVDFDDVLGRPVLIGYNSEQITNWGDGWIVLCESYQAIDPDDPYIQKSEKQYRELVLIEGVYWVRIWRKQDGGEWGVFSEVMPTSKGQSLDYIPFIPVSMDGINLSPEVPPMLDLTSVNLSQYRTSADLEHGRHFTGLPTPYATGINADSEINLGSEGFLAFPDPNTKVGFLEFSGAGLASLERAMEEKRQIMASLGAQLMQGNKAAAEAAETVKLKQNAEFSIVVRSAKLVESAINSALRKSAEWVGGPDMFITINLDFADTQLNPQQLTALMALWQSGGISHDTLLYNLKRGEILESDIDADTEKQRIDTDAPQSMGLIGDANG